MHIDLSCPCFWGSSGKSEVGGVVKFLDLHNDKNDRSFASFSS